MNNQALATRQKPEEEKKEISPLKSFNAVIKNERTQDYLKMVLGAKKDSFVTSLLSAVANDANLQLCDPMSLIYTAMKATSMNLPIDPNLGFAAIIPYKDGKENKTKAQFQIMRNGYVELLMRTGQVKFIANEAVHEGELVKANKFTGEYVFDEASKTSDKIIGYMAYVKLINGFEKTVYWPIEDCLAHAKRYSQTAKKGYGLWIDNQQSMCLKGLALDTPIPTPDGFTTMGEIQVGDKLYNALGEETTVIAKSEVKNLPCYEIIFQNGDSFICDEEHRWVVRGPMGSNIPWRVLNTQELYVAKALGYAIVMPDNPCVEFSEKELPIDPYILGYWLGNGSRCAATVCCDEDDADEIVARFEQFYEVNTRHDNRSRSVVLNISSKTGGRKDGSSLKQQLKALGVYGNKHIPEIYQRASVEQRLELVRGLCDSDGSIDSTRGRMVFCSTRQELSDGLYTILASLGEKVNRYSGMGRGYGATCTFYNVVWQPFNCPVALKRKAARFHERINNKANSIKAVRKVESVPTQCIAVDSGNAIEEEDLRKTFLIGDGFYVTHNTVLKHLIVKYMPKSVELLDAVRFDQASVDENGNPDYVDGVDDQTQREEYIAEEKAALRERNEAQTGSGEGIAPKLL